MEADILLLADSAQVVDNKLYLLGGGWRYVRARHLPATHPMAVGIGLLVDWTETNRRHGFRLEVLQHDSDRPLFAMDGEFEQGTPPGLEPGSQQRFLMALNVSPALETAGEHEVRLKVDGQAIAATRFTVLAPRA
jgi:hypothetical protein